MSRQFFPAPLRSALAAAQRSDVLERLEQAIRRTAHMHHGKLAEWEQLIAALAPGATAHTVADKAGIEIGTPDSQDPIALRACLEALIPWRKGPFVLAGEPVETEWRSDMKWDRLAPHLSDIRGRHVLDVGSGNGYFALRLAAAGAASVIGIDPTALFVCQFLLFARLGLTLPVGVAPLAMEDLANSSLSFDTVLSMGVLYHRRSPIEHLRELRQALADDGELVLETLVIDGDENTVLTPENRYARMRNVWFIPSVAALERWLARVGFSNIRVVDVSTTELSEQRRTDWMPFESLAEALSTETRALTIEGYPAPRRAIVLANR